jgi:hypothetical protein
MFTSLLHRTYQPPNSLCHYWHVGLNSPRMRTTRLIVGMVRAWPFTNRLDWQQDSKAPKTTCICYVAIYDTLPRHYYLLPRSRAHTEAAYGPHVAAFGPINGPHMGPCGAQHGPILCLVFTHMRAPYMGTIGPMRAHMWNEVPTYDLRARRSYVD